MTERSISIMVCALLLCAAMQSMSQVFEAEAGEKTGVQTSSQRTGYSGTGYVTGLDSDGDRINVSCYVSRGVYKLYVRYASPSGPKQNFLLVNNEVSVSAYFPASSVFTETFVGKVFLEKGTNSIGLLKEWGYVDIDNFRLERSEPSPFDQVVNTLVTPQPTRAADSLYQFLRSIYGKVLLSGQYGGSTEFNRIKNLTGTTPVIRGFDLIDYSPSRVEHGTSPTETDQVLSWHQNEKGISTVMWHWNAPKDLIDQPGKEWWRGFYTDATTFDVQKAMSDPASTEYQLIIRDIDVIAGQLARLKAANIPILWRPLHEAEGRWFWWGAKGPEPCKWLWKLLFDRLVNHHKLDNLIWVWTSSISPDALAWYPGDDYVDMIGADIYLPDGTKTSSFTMFDQLANIFQGKKIICMSENGPIPDAEKAFLEGAAWSWFCTWSGDFITSEKKNTATHIKNTFFHDYTITMDEIHQLPLIIDQLAGKREEYLADGEITAVDDQKGFPFTGDGSVVHFHCSAQAQVAVYSLFGQRLDVPISCGAGKCEVSLRSLRSGIYLVRIAERQQVKIFRVFKF